MQPPSSSLFNGTHSHDQTPANFVSASCSKPVVVGLYGLPGSGKSFLLNTLKRGLSHDEFSFYDGSHVIAEVTPGGLEAFQILQGDDKNDIRNRAMGKIKQESCDRGKCAIVTGHAMFWAEEEETGQLICTPADLETYTHILYLDVPAEVTASRLAP